ncbi:hypothetical protein EL26_22945 [Tumebacillus flagellatus]|uniref:Uncharacterized protein n=2 Tax=Tumebacillus flagellatus TaxID=1157490 RepID=A0A074LKC3_9BACL|nr:hypothetical protein EL26_22945 [Tumebacillus flagellatus]
MWTYCTPDDVAGLFKPIKEDPETFDPDYLSGFIRKAQIHINERLRPHYVVPLVEPIPEVITSICADLAASFVLENHFSDIMYREDVPLASNYRRRAQSELDHVIEFQTLDGLPGIRKHAPEVPEQRRRVFSTTPNPSPMQGRLDAFDSATRGNTVSGGRWPY